jgi:hypothetical protein
MANEHPNKTGASLAILGENIPRAHRDSGIQNVVDEY